MKILVLLSALFVSVGPVKAQSNEAKYYYWNGVAYTAGNILCGLARERQIDKEYANNFLSEILISYSRDPQMEQYMSAIKQGINSATDECQDVYF